MHSVRDVSARVGDARSAVRAQRAARRRRRARRARWQRAHRPRPRARRLALANELPAADTHRLCVKLAPLPELVI